ncbi:MAG: DUF1214 domain-containing protein [Halioglobus sp.]|nr:DUF1214 domain-containing protein [Halioglobus sp.]
MASESAQERVHSGKVWADFCDQLKAAGEVILRDSSPDSELDRAEGWRYLSRLVRLSLEQYVEHSDTSAPTFYRLSHETAKIGCDNPDCIYGNAVLDSEMEYRITGTRGDVDYLSFGTFSGGYGQGGKTGPTGFLDVKDMQFEADGSIEIIVSRRPQAKNWLPMKDNSNLMIVRQLLKNRRTDQMAVFTIEPLNGKTTPQRLTAEKLAQGFTAAANFVNSTAAIFANHVENFKRTPNELVYNPIDKASSLGDPNNTIWYGYWALRENEALVIEVDPPECEFWNFQVNNYWEESLDYRYLDVTVNKYSARYEADGSLKIVIAHRDPGMGNWLVTEGHDVGTLCFRWTCVESMPQPRTRVVKLA